MNAVAVIQANLERSPIGTASRLAESLAGEAVLTRTVRRVLAARSLSGVIVTTAPAHHDRTSELVSAAYAPSSAEGERVIVRMFDGPPAPAASTILAARKWSLHSWRGGFGNTCFFDEHTHAPLYSAIAEQLGATAIVGVAAEAPLIDPATIDGMIQQMIDQADDEIRTIFAQAPPGLAPTVFRADLLHEAAEAGVPIGWINAYKPERPRADMIVSGACYRMPLAVQHTVGRMTSDTRRGFDRLAVVLAAGEPQGVEDTCVRWRTVCGDVPEPFPHEIQIELTTNDPLPRTRMRPRGAQLERNGCLDVDGIAGLAAQISAYDDVCVVLGGFGDPLLHPSFDAVVRALRAAGVFGLAVRTTGLPMDAAAREVLVNNQIDAVQVLIDAWGAERYAERHGGTDGAAELATAYETVLEHIEALAELRRANGQSIPAVVPSLTKARETLDEIEPFFENWLTTHGWAVIDGYSHHAGLVEDLRVMNMAPPGRRPCRQLDSRFTILADGRVASCDQDFRGMHILGNIHEQSIADIWNGPPLADLRAAHAAERYDAHPMCAGCEEWHRP